MAIAPIGALEATLSSLATSAATQQQTIAVGEAAVSAHLAHGDQTGACPNGCASGCDDGNLCTSDACGPEGQCVHTAVSCDDAKPMHN